MYGSLEGRKMNTFANLAGNHRCDATIRRELAEAGIPVFELPVPMNTHASSPHANVSSSLLGLLYKDGIVVFKLYRDAHYWVAKGDVSLEVARELCQKGKEGREIRAGGDLSMVPRPPETWAEWRDDCGRILINEKERETLERVKYALPADFFEKYAFVENPSAVGNGFVTFYQIDAQEGLNLFVKTLREHKLVD